MHLEVDKTDFRKTRLIDSEIPGSLEPGQVLLEVDRYALTANNVTYAVAGEAFDYWGFFPTTEPWGRIPMMGYGVVAASEHPDISPGERYFGFFPMASHLVVEPQGSADVFVDNVEHRCGHAAIYRSYNKTNLDPVYDETRQDHYLLLRGVFLTSFLVDDHLADNDFFGASSVIVTSASSKTSIALGSLLRERPQIEAIGLTSARNRAFVEGLGLYDSVLTYDEVGSLDASVPSVLADMASNAELTTRIHNRLADSVKNSCQIGLTHWESTDGLGDLPGAQPEFFFAPTHFAAKLIEGDDSVRERAAKSLGRFVADSPDWLSIERVSGAEDAEQAYLDTVDGNVAPDRGLVVSMSPTVG